MIGGRKGEIDIPATSLDWMSWNNPAIVSTAEYDWMDRALDRSQSETTAL